MKTIIKVVLIFGGLLLLAASLLADVLWSGHYPGFNGIQIAGAAFGLLTFILGLIFGRGKKKA
jgi:hypothetical protein